MSNSRREKLHELQNNPNSVNANILSTNANNYQIKERLCIYKDYVRVTLSRFRNQVSPDDLLYLVIQFHIQFTKQDIWWKTLCTPKDIIPSVTHGRKFIPFNKKNENTKIMVRLSQHGYHGSTLYLVPPGPKLPLKV